MKEERHEQIVQWQAEDEDKQRPLWADYNEQQHDGDHTERGDLNAARQQPWADDDYHAQECDGNDPRIGATVGGGVYSHLLMA